MLAGSQRADGSVVGGGGTAQMAWGGGKEGRWRCSDYYGPCSLAIYLCSRWVWGSI